MARRMRPANACIAVAIPDDVLEKIASLAARQWWTRSTAARYLIEAGLASNGLADTPTTPAAPAMPPVTASAA